MNRRKLNWLKDRARRKAQRLYRRSAGDEGVAVSLDADVDSKTMLMTFGGMKSTVGIVAFEFVALTSSIPVKKMFVRDPRQSWYHRGMPSHGTTLESVGDVLQRILSEHEVERLVCVGSSAGGYAALLFGALLGADEVLAFGPQTTLDRDTLAAMDDHRWDYLLAPLYAKAALEERWIDLRSALPEVLRPPTRCKVYYDETVPGDRAHAEHIAAIEGVRMYRFGRGGHSLTRALRDCGALERLLRDALQVPAGAGEPTADLEQAPNGAGEQAELRYRTYR